MHIIKFICALPLMALLLLSSCDKQDTSIVEEDLNGFDAAQEGEATGPEDLISEFEFDGQTIKVGETYQAGTFRAFERMAGVAERVAEAKANTEKTSRGIESFFGNNRWIIVQVVNKCTTGCTANGMEFLGKKGSSYIQIHNCPASDPYCGAGYGSTFYIGDPKSLTNSNIYCSPTYKSYHKYLLRCFNEEVKVTAYFISADGTGSWAVLDTDVRSSHMEWNDTEYFNAFSDAEAQGSGMSANECAILYF